MFAWGQVKVSHIAREQAQFTELNLGLLQDLLATLSYNHCYHRCLANFYIISIDLPLQGLSSVEDIV